jgi:hypothetical protein
MTDAPAEEIARQRALIFDKSLKEIEEMLEDEIKAQDLQQNLIREAHPNT